MGALQKFTDEAAYAVAVNSLAQKRGINPLHLRVLLLCDLVNAKVEEPVMAEIAKCAMLVLQDPETKREVLELLNSGRHSMDLPLRTELDVNGQFS